LQDSSDWPVVSLWFSVSVPQFTGVLSAQLDGVAVPEGAAPDSTVHRVREAADRLASAQMPLERVSWGTAVPLELTM
jgi:hypothetical protein